MGYLQSARQLASGTMNLPVGLLADSFARWQAAILASALLFMGVGYFCLGAAGGLGGALVGSPWSVSAPPRGTRPPWARSRYASRSAGPPPSRSTAWGPRSRTRSRRWPSAPCWWSWPGAFSPRAPAGGDRRSPPGVARPGPAVQGAGGAPVEEGAPGRRAGHPRQPGVPSGRLRRRPHEHGAPGHRHVFPALHTDRPRTGHLRARRLLGPVARDGHGVPARPRRALRSDGAEGRAGSGVPAAHRVLPDARLGRARLAAWPARSRDPHVLIHPREHHDGGELDVAGPRLQSSATAWPRSSRR